MKLFERESSAAATAAPKPKPVPDTTLKNGESQEAAPAAGDEPLRRSAPPAAGPAVEEARSVLGETLHIRGEIEAAEDLLLEGRVEGSIRHTANRLTIGATGVVHADIDAKNLVIEGTVEGNVVGSESVVIRETADVRGNVYTARISIADGARFSGTVDMDLSRSPRH